jgi:hypothetical protein
VSLVLIVAATIILYVVGSLASGGVSFLTIGKTADLLVNKGEAKRASGGKASVSSVRAGHNSSMAASSMWPLRPFLAVVFAGRPQAASPE